IEENDALKGSMSANAEIIVNEKTDVVYVPVDAIQKRNGKSYVRVVSGETGTGKTGGNRNSGSTDNAGENTGTAVRENNQQSTEQQIEMREVTTGISTAEYIEIVSGLKEGEIVVVTSQSSSSDNQRGQEMMMMGGPPSGGGPSGGGDVRVRGN
ncbi:MAG: hypothetical protein VB106_19840, partial [Clostridiaceae bacterium]|nr:hypothetical protein [Clostridiaceae bacterium]